MTGDDGRIADGDRAFVPSGSSLSPQSRPEASIPCARPKSSDPEIRRAAILKLAEDCAKWGNDKPEDWVECLSRLSLHGNGYELARDLERDAYVTPDPELVEILDSASSYIWDAEREAVKEWVAATGIKPPLPIGTRVNCRRGTGEITGIYEEDAQYVVLPDDERNSPKYSRGGGWLIPYDQASAIEAGTDATAQTGAAEGESAVRDSGDAQ